MNYKRTWLRKKAEEQQNIRSDESMEEMDKESTHVMIVCNLRESSLYSHCATVVLFEQLIFFPICFFLTTSMQKTGNFHSLWILLKLLYINWLKCLLLGT